MFGLRRHSPGLTTVLRLVSEQDKRSTEGGVGLGVGHQAASSWPVSGGFYHCGAVCRSTWSVPALQQPHDSGMILQQVRILPPLLLSLIAFIADFKLTSIDLLLYSEWMLAEGRSGTYIWLRNWLLSTEVEITHLYLNCWYIWCSLSRKNMWTLWI